MVQLTCAAFSGSVLAYIGPGLGGTAIAVVLGILASVALAVFTIFWYPVLSI